MIEIRQYEAKDLLRQENVRVGGRLLDVGAGEKKPFAAAFISLGGDRQKTVVLDQNYAYENNRGRKIGLMLAGDVQQLPFEDNSFRWAALGWFLDACKGERQQLLSEVYRVLENGGSLLGDVWLKPIVKDIARVNEDMESQLVAEAGRYKQMISDAGFVMADNSSFFGTRKGQEKTTVNWCFVGNK